MLKNDTSFYIAKRYFVAHRSKIGLLNIIKTLATVIIGAVPFLLFSLFAIITGKKNKYYQKFIESFLGQNFITVLSNISMVGVGVGTAALIIILSVFNGLEELTKTLYGTYNAEIKITPVYGKSFEVGTSLLEEIEAIENVAAVTEVIQDDAFLRYAGAEMMVVLKGVSDNYLEQYPMEKMLVSGSYDIYNEETMRALVGIGVQHQLSIQLSDKSNALVFHYPRKGQGVSLNPDRSVLRRSILPGGVLAVEQQFDAKYIIVPLDFAKELMQYENSRTSLEVKVNNPSNVSRVQKSLKDLLGDDFDVLNADEQQASVLRAVKIERLFVFITFIVILGIASFNVFFSLAMLAIEKKKDIAILFSMGANESFIKRIFLIEGFIVAVSGASFGLLAGLVIVYLQQTYGFVPLGVPSSIIDAYPVKIQAMDFLYSGIVIMAITFAASYIPAVNASKTKLHEHI